MSYFDYEKTLLGYLENIKAQILARPLNLGGVTSSGGGAGGPPGGFTGYLPQTRVAYDLTEAASNVIPSISGSLLDNLNHIRYRISGLESSTGPGSITVKQDGVLVASGITVVDFYNSTVAIVSPTEVSVTSTGGGGSSHSHKYNVTVSGTTHFTIPETISSGTLRVYYNGVRQDDNYFTVDGDYLGFTLGFSAVAGDEVFVDYDLATSSGTSGGGHIIQDEGVSQTQRSKLNFVGAGVTVTDDAGNDATIITIDGGSGGGSTSNAPFVVTATITGITYATVIPGLAGAAERKGFKGAGISIEFDGSDDSGLVWDTPPSVMDYTTFPSILYMEQDSVYTGNSLISWTPTDPNNWSVIAKMGTGSLDCSFGFKVFDAAQVSGAIIFLKNPTSQGFNSIQAQSYVSPSSTNRGTAFNMSSSMVVYMKISWDSVSGNLVWSCSDTGVVWHKVTSLNPFAFTPGKLDVFMSIGAGRGQTMIDFIRGS